MNDAALRVGEPNLVDDEVTPQKSEADSEGVPRNRRIFAPIQPTVKHTAAIENAPMNAVAAIWSMERAYSAFSPIRLTMSVTSSPMLSGRPYSMPKSERLIVKTASPPTIGFLFIG